jgi:hypothetical protein
VLAGSKLVTTEPVLVSGAQPHTATAIAVIATNPGPADRE